MGIMDTDTLLFSFSLECPPKRVIDRIAQQFDLFFPDKVFQEYRSQLSKGQLERYDSVRSDIDLYFTRKRKEGKLVEETKYAYCLEYVQRFFCMIGKQKEYESLGEGEKHCIALGLYLSHKMKTCIVVLTDDFGAREAGIDFFACKTCLGSVHSLLGAMVFIYCISKDIPELHMRTLVNDYFSLNPAKRANTQRFREKIIHDIKLCCRRQNLDKCGLSCLT